MELLLCCLLANQDSCLFLTNWRVSFEAWGSQVAPNGQSQLGFLPPHGCSELGKTHRDRALCLVSNQVCAQPWATLTWAEGLRADACHPRPILPVTPDSPKQCLQLPGQRGEGHIKQSLETHTYVMT